MLLMKNERKKNEEESKAGASKLFLRNHESCQKSKKAKTEKVVEDVTSTIKNLKDVVFKDK